MTTSLRPEDPAALGPHRLVARLGQGGMGRVYLASSRAGRLLAVKAIHPRYADDPKFRARFRREIAAARLVTGVFTAPIVDADPDGSPPWLATAYIPGPSLRDAVLRYGALPEDAVRMLGAGLAEALDAVHAAGLAHRDVKPSNVLLAADGPRLIDFGISRAAADATLTADGAVIGSPGYLSPEQADAEEVGPASDIFSLGATLVFAATGRPPFGEGHLEIMLYRVGHEDPDLGSVPGPLRDILAACLRRDPGQRPAARELPGLFLPEPDMPMAVGDEWLPKPVAAEVTASADAAASIMSGTKRQRPFGRRQILAGLTAGGVTAVLAGTAAWLPDGAEFLSSALRKTTPRELWRKQAPHRSIAVIGDLLLHDEGQNLIAVDLRTGSRRWETQVFAHPDDPGGPEPPGGEPEPLLAMVGDTLYVAGTPDDSLRRLDPATGTVMATTQPGDLFTAATILGAQGSVVFCGDDASTTLTAVDVARGQALWTIDRQPEDTITIPPSGGLVFHTQSPGLVHAYTVADGKERWQANTESSVRRPLVLDRGTVYAAGRHLYALDAATGRRRWALTGLSESGTGSVVVRGDDVFTSGTELRAIDRRTGAPRWRTDTPEIGHLAISGDLLLASWLGPPPNDRDEGILGWDVKTGKQRWRYTFPSQDVVPNTGPATYIAPSGDPFVASYSALIIAFHVS